MLNPPQSDEQRKKFHAMLRDISKQVQWAGLWWSEEDWKKLVLGAQFGQTVGPNPFGHGLLILNKRSSSSLKKPEYSDLIAELQAFGDENGVKWSEPE